MISSRKSAVDLWVPALLFFYTYVCILVSIMVVRMRATKSHRNNRRSHIRLSSPAITHEAGSSVAHMRHRASLVTGKYKGRVVIDMQAKLDKKAKKAKARTAEGR